MFSPQDTGYSVDTASLPSLPISQRSQLPAIESTSPVESRRTDEFGQVLIFDKGEKMNLVSLNGEGELTATEVDRLAACEEVINQNLKAFYNVGAALLEIRNSKLYRQEFKTFEDYCDSKWSMSKPQAYRLLDASEVRDNLSPIGDVLPEKESHIRELKKLKQPELQREVWAEVLSAVGNDVRQVKAEVVEQAVSKRIKPKPSPTTKSNPGPTSINSVERDNCETQKSHTLETAQAPPVEPVQTESSQEKPAETAHPETALAALLEEITELKADLADADRRDDSQAKEIERLRNALSEVEAENLRLRSLIGELEGAANKMHPKAKVKSTSDRPKAKPSPTPGGEAPMQSDEQELAARLRVKSVRNMKAKWWTKKPQRFIAWTVEKDPDGYGWEPSGDGLGSFYNRIDPSKEATQ